jgi:hypothetical protein
MSETAPAAAPSAPAASTPSTPSSTPSSVPNVSSRSTTAELSQKLYGDNNTAPSLESQLETPDSGDVSSDAPWYERYSEGVHGVQAQEILEALERGEVPPALHDKLRFQLRDGDNETEVDLAALQNGAMMQRNFTRKSQELAEERKAFYSERDEFAGYLTNWKTDPQQLLYGMERMGLPVLEAAKLLAERLTYADTLNAAVPGSGDEWMEAQKSKAELADLRRAQQAQLDQAQQVQQADKTSKVRTNLQNTSKEIFNKIGLEIEESSWSLYTQHVQAIFDAKPSGNQKLTKQDLERAAKATKTQIDQYAQAYLKRQPKKAPGIGNSLDAGAPKAVPGRAPGKPGGKTTEQVLQEMQARQRVGR